MKFKLFFAFLILFLSSTAVLALGTYKIEATGVQIFALVDTPKTGTTRVDLIGGTTYDFSSKGTYGALNVFREGGSDGIQIDYINPLKDPADPNSAQDPDYIYKLLHVKKVSFNDLPFGVALPSSLFGVTSPSASSSGRVAVGRKFFSFELLKSGSNSYDALNVRVPKNYGDSKYVSVVSGGSYQSVWSQQYFFPVEVKDADGETYTFYAKKLDFYVQGVDLKKLFSDDASGGLSFSSAVRVEASTYTPLVMHSAKTSRAAVTQTFEVKGPAVIKTSDASSGAACPLSKVTTSAGVAEVKPLTPMALTVKTSTPSTTQGGGAPVAQVDLETKLERVTGVTLNTGGAAAPAVQANSLCKGLTVPAGATAIVTSQADAVSSEFVYLTPKTSKITFLEAPATQSSSTHDTYADYDFGSTPVKIRVEGSYGAKFDFVLSVTAIRFGHADASATAGKPLFDKIAANLPTGKIVKGTLISLASAAELWQTVGVKANAFTQSTYGGVANVFVPSNPFCQFPASNLQAYFYRSEPYAPTPKISVDSSAGTISYDFSPYYLPVWVTQGTSAVKHYASKIVIKNAAKIKAQQGVYASFEAFKALTSSEAQKKIDKVSSVCGNDEKRGSGLVKNGFEFAAKDGSVTFSELSVEQYAVSGVKFKSLNAKQSSDYATLLVDYELEKTPAPKASDSIQIMLYPALYDENQSIFDSLNELGGREYSNATDWKTKLGVKFYGAKVFYGSSANPNEKSVNRTNVLNVLYSRGGEYYATMKKEFLAWDFVTNPGKAQELLVPAVYGIAGVVNNASNEPQFPQFVDLNVIKLGIRKNAATGAAETQYVTPAKLTQVVISTSKEARVGKYVFQVFLSGEGKLAVMHGEGKPVAGEDVTNPRKLGEWRKFSDFGENVSGYVTQPEEYKTRGEYVLTLYFGELAREPLAKPVSVALKDRGETCSPNEHPTKADYVDYCVKYWKKATPEQLKYKASLDALRAECEKLFFFDQGVLTKVSNTTNEYNFNGAQTPVGNCMPLASGFKLGDANALKLACRRNAGGPYGRLAPFVCVAAVQLKIGEPCIALAGLKWSDTECENAPYGELNNRCLPPYTSPADGKTLRGKCAKYDPYVAPKKASASCDIVLASDGAVTTFYLRELTASKIVSLKTKYSLVYLKNSNGDKIAGSEQKTGSWAWHDNIDTDTNKVSLVVDSGNIKQSHFEDGGSAVFEFRDSHDNVVYEAECKLTDDQLHDVFISHRDAAPSIGTCEASLDMSKNAADPLKWTFIVKYNPTAAFQQKTLVKPGDLKKLYAIVDDGDQGFYFWFDVASFKKDTGFIAFVCGGTSMCFVKPQTFSWNFYSRLAALKESFKKQGKPQKAVVTVYAINPADYGKADPQLRFIAQTSCFLDLTRMPSNLKKPTQ